MKTSKIAILALIALFYTFQTNSVWAACSISWNYPPSYVRTIYDREGGQQVFSEFQMRFNIVRTFPPCQQLVLDVTDLSAAQVDARVNETVASILELAADSHPDLTAIYPSGTVR